ncbi:MAG: response regulator [Candidatus Obscuribacterales bacterium]|nr:MAG: response regulator [Candidatus Melainabacteria bacterium]
MPSILQGLHVMVVEDTMTQAMMIQHVLEKEQVQVTIARSGEKAMKTLADIEPKPQLILCDVNMPEMDGYQLCLKLKADEALRNIPFVLLSTLVDNTDLLRVIECGADNFIYKTFEGEYFIQRLESIWSSCSEDAATEAQALKIMLDGRQHNIVISSQKLVNLLSSAFETAVFHNRTHKSGA